MDMKTVNLLVLITNGTGKQVSSFFFLANCVLVIHMNVFSRSAVVAIRCVL